MWKIIKRLKLNRLMKRLRKEIVGIAGIPNKPTVDEFIDFGSFLGNLDGKVESPHGDFEHYCEDCEFTIAHTLSKQTLTEIDCEILMDADACSTGYED